MRRVLSTWPRRSVWLCQGASVTPSADTANAPPVTAMRQVSAATSHTPPNWANSSAAVSGGLPTSTLAADSDGWSIAPDTETPKRRQPRRPVSWIVT